MSPLLVVVVVACSLVSVSASPPAPHTVEEAAHRLEMILNNTRSRENYIRCFMDRGICNKDAQSIKRILSDALATNCSNCTEIQRLGADRFFQYLQDRQPQTWTALTNKYDTTKSKDKEDDDDESEESDDDDDKKGAKENSLPKGEGKESDGANMMKDNSTEISSTISIIF